MVYKIVNLKMNLKNQYSGIIPNEETYAYDRYGFIGEEIFSSSKILNDYIKNCFQIAKKSKASRLVISTLINNSVRLSELSVSIDGCLIELLPFYDSFPKTLIIAVNVDLRRQIHYQVRQSFMRRFRTEIYRGQLEIKPYRNF